MKSYHDRQAKKVNSQGVNIALEPHETLYDIDEAPEAFANMGQKGVLQAPLLSPSPQTGSHV